jgi:hypothetical protein
MTWIAMQLDPDGDTPRGWVATTEDNMTVAIVCRRINGEWTPEYALRQSNDEWHPRARLPLPPGFTLDATAAEALEDVVAEVV